MEALRGAAPVGVADPGDSNDDTDGFRALGGKFSSVGERYIVLSDGLVGELEKPSRPKPWVPAAMVFSYSSLSGGGVGVRGGWGIGRVEAMLA